MSYLRIDSESISVADALELFNTYGNLTYVFDNKDILVMNRSHGEFVSIGEVSYIQVSHGETFMMNQTQYFPDNKIGEAIGCWTARLLSEFPNRAFGDSYDLKDIKIINSKKLVFRSHYDYCDAMLEKFWLKVFHKTPDEMWCSGITGSHGDKCYSYKRDWEEAGIEFHHGVLLFLLTYTQALGDTPKHESCQWVIDNYPLYKPMIDDVEKEILKEKYDIIS